ncbi:hypothetical protein [[Mycoplasma] testudinis]|uniref:hypothetical protein n=1 Tax=[Mycoplasma] testudinis TaxID=33924 RepID=UPI00048867ED|nr:hypothetical protein [[Mycoplasma] testudinis]
MASSKKTKQPRSDSKLIIDNIVPTKLQVKSRRLYPTKPDVFRVGHDVKILLAEYAGFTGTIVELDRIHKQAKVQVELLGKELSLIIDYKNIELDK